MDVSAGGAKMTGYTYKLVEDNQSFEEFVWTCVRAMGVCIDIRDEEMGAHIDLHALCKIDPSYEIRVKEKELALKKLLKLKTDAQRIDYGKRIKQDRINSYKECAEEKSIQKANKILRSMIRKVERWHPPTSKHKTFKEFMLNQLNSSLSDYDHSKYYTKQIDKIKKQHPLDIYQCDLLYAQQGLDSAKKHLQDHIININDRRDWFNNLIASVPQPEKKVK